MLFLSKKLEDEAVSLDRHEMLQILPEIGGYQRVRSLRGVYKNALSLVLDPLRLEKTSYDEQSLKYKTPLALSEINDPHERTMVLSNIKSFATTHGCTGGCRWCGFEAMLMKSSNLDVVPLEQQKHFVDELINLCGENKVDLQKLIKRIFWFDANDSLDDPNIIELLSYVYEKTGVTPFVSSVAPKGGKDRFIELARYTMEYRKLDYLKSLNICLEVLIDFFKNIEGVNNINDLRGLEYSTALNVFKDQLSLLVGLSKFSDSSVARPIREVSLNALNARYDSVILEALDSFSLGDFEDYFDYKENQISDIESCLQKMECFESYDAFQTLLNGLIVNFKKVDMEYYDDQGLTFSILFADKSISVLKQFLIYVEDVLEVFDIDKGELTFDDFGRQKLLNEISSMELKLKGVPKVIMRLSDIGKNQDLIELRGKDLWFSCEDRTDGDLYKLGKLHTEKGDSFDEDGISCRNGMLLNPFGLYNVVTGKVTKEFSQGRCVVPFEGLKKQNNCSVGETVFDLLKNTIVISSNTFSKAPNIFYVYDGDGYTRKIKVDVRSYEVIEDQIVRYS